MGGTLRFEQVPQTRTEAQALMRWLIEADPASGLIDLVLVVLTQWLQRQGETTPPISGTIGRAIGSDPVSMLGERWIEVPDNEHTAALIDAAVGRLSHILHTGRAWTLGCVWRDAIADLHWRIDTPISDEDLGPPWLNPETLSLAAGESVPDHGIWRRTGYGPPNGPSQWERLD